MAETRPQSRSREAILRALEFFEQPNTTSAWTYNDMAREEIAAGLREGALLTPSERASSEPQAAAPSARPTPPRWRVKDEAGDDLIAFWRTFPAPSNEVAAADIIEELERDVAHWKRMHECAQNANAYRQDALEDFATSSQRATEAVPVADIEAEIQHIRQNGIDLARFSAQDADEGRCRELCAMYLQEFITSERMRKKLVALDSATRPKYVDDLKPGDTFRADGYGLVRFERWDVYMGQRTAEISLLDYNEERRNPLPEDLQERIIRGSGG